MISILVNFSYNTRKLVFNDLIRLYTGSLVYMGFRGPQGSRSVEPFSLLNSDKPRNHAVYIYNYCL